MSTFKVEVVEVSEVMNHPNADRLDLVKMQGKDWQCVTSKGNYKVGDRALYFPIDSILTPKVEDLIFGLDSKIKLTKSRVKTIKLRGAISQGLIARLELFIPAATIPYLKIGHEFTETLGITKYEPKQATCLGGGVKSTPRNNNPNFRKYTGIENAKNYSNVFTEGEQVSVTEKIHGTNFRAGYVPFYADTFWKKVKKWLGFAPEYEFVYGSHNVQLQSRLLYKGFYESNVYSEAVINYRLRELLQPGEVVYGEIYGYGIQKNYDYGCSDRRLILFDVMIDSLYIDTISFKKWTDARGLPTVPELYRGPFNKETILKLRDGNSILAPTQKVREGVVVKPLVEENSYIGRKVLKFISDDYLLKNQDEESVGH